ncbi:MAG: hypothetical protein NVS4B2_07380 [Chloroflexota bacterium]
MSVGVQGGCLEILDHGAFTDLATEWESLLRQSYDNRLFLSSTWLAVWWRHFDPGTARKMTARDETGALTRIIPLQIQDGAMSLVGDHNVADYLDGLAVKYGAQQTLAALWLHALENISFSHLDLRHVPSAPPLILALLDAAQSFDLRIDIADDEVCPVAILCNDWDGYLNTLTKRQRYEIRRKLCRTRDGVEWVWRTVTSPDQLEADLQIFFRLHEASASDKARFLTPRMRSFFAELNAILLQDGILRLSTFTREGIDVAATVSFLHRGRYLLYNLGYDPEFAPHHPGIASVALAMQDAISLHAVAFDFLSGDEAYKFGIGATKTHTCRIAGARR